MGTGIHVQIGVEGVDSCPVISMSEQFEIDSIVTDRQPTATGCRITGEATVSDSDGASTVSDSSDRIIADGTRSIIRFRNERGGCPCDRVPDHDCPIRDVSVESGTLVVSFIVPDTETLQAIVADLRSCCESVRVRRLVQSREDDQQTLRFVDRSEFTDRQFEVLQTAWEMGYFASPKEADSAAVAAELGISVSTFSEHLAAAQEKLLDQILSV